MSEVMHANDIRMIQRGERVGFLFKSRGELRIVCTLRRENFQRNEAVQRFLTRLVNHAHATATETLDDFELREVRCEFLGRQRGYRRGLISGLRGLHGTDHEAAWAETDDCIGR